jgi:hypothetical protein
VNVSVTTCPGKTLWLASTNSIFTLCSPGGSPAMSTVLLSLASAPQPGQVVDGYVQMPETWRCVEGARPEHR